VAVSLIWRIMLNPDIGVLNYLLRSVGLPGSLWVSSEKMVIPALMVVVFLLVLVFNAVMNRMRLSAEDAR
jgi:ABC-type sugar transport system permease subunit